MVITIKVKFVSELVQKFYFYKPELLQIIISSLCVIHYIEILNIGISFCAFLTKIDFIFAKQNEFNIVLVYTSYRNRNQTWCFKLILPTYMIVIALKGFEFEWFMEFLFGFKAYIYIWERILFYSMTKYCNEFEYEFHHQSWEG